MAEQGIVRRIFANLGLLISGKAAAGLISLGYMMIAARSLGPSDYGMLVLVHGYAMTVGGIIEFPGWHAIVRYGAHARETRDPARLVRLLRFAGVVELAGGLLAIIVAAALGPIIGPHLGWSVKAQAMALPYSLAVLASIRATPAGYLQLVGRFDLLGFHNMVAPLVRLGGALIAALLGSGLHGFLIAWLIAALAEWAAMWCLGLWIARRDLRGHRMLGSLAGIRSENPGIWRFMVAANADITFSEFAGRITPLVIGWVLGPIAAGLFAIGQRATVIIQQPALILGQAVYAEFAKLAAGQGNGLAIRRALIRSLAIAFAVALPVVVIIALLAKPLAVILGGKAFAAAAGIMIWLSVARLILLVAPPISSALVALGKPGWSVGTNVLTNLLLLPILPPALWIMGLPGAGAQAVLQAIVAAMILCVLLWRATSEPVPACPAPQTSS